MKIGKYFSLISTIIAIVCVIHKLQLDIITYNTTLEVISVSEVDFASTFIPFVMDIYFIITLISLVLSIIGFKKKNHFRKLALGLNILAVVYMIVPVGSLMSIF